MSVLRMAYLVLAILGAGVPMMSYVPWIWANGGGMFSLVSAWQANGATTGLYFDMLIAALALNVWIVGETYARKDYWVLFLVPVIYLVGVSAALPLFLFLRTRPAR